MTVTFPVPPQSQEFQHAALDVLGNHPSAKALIKKFSDATGVGHFLDGHSGRLQSISDVVTGDDSFQCKVTVAEYSELNKGLLAGERRRHIRSPCAELLSLASRRPSATYITGGACGHFRVTLACSDEGTEDKREMIRARC